MATSLSVLIVEDSEKDTALMLRELKKTGLTIVHERVTSAVQLAGVLERGTWDVVISDYDLPGFGAIDALRIVKAKDAELPFIVVSGAIGEEVAVETMKAGAQDYVMKDRLVRLAPTLLREVRDADHRRARARAARRLALQNEITRLLAHATRPCDAMLRVLEALGEYLGWRVGCFWSVQGGALRCQAMWQAGDVVEDLFMGATLASALQRGQGLPGKVWESGRSEWADFARSEEVVHHRRIAAHVGLRSACAFPVFLDHSLYGVVELLGGERPAPDAELMDTMRAVGTQLAQFLRRARALEALKASEAHKAAILQAAVDAIVSTDARGKILEWNPAAERMFGYTREEVLGQSMEEVIVPPELRERFEGHFHAYLERPAAEGLGRRVRTLGLRKDGKRVPTEVVITRIQEAGSTQLTGYIRDISAELKNERNQRLLSSASATLSASSLDYVHVLDRVANLFVPAIADGCIVEVGEDEQPRHDVAVAASDAETARMLRKRVVELDWHATDAREAMRARRLVGRPGPPEGEVPLSGADAPAALRAMGMRAYVCLPLIARGRSFGAISLFCVRPDRRYDDIDLGVIEDLVRRAAFAIDNAHLYQHARESVRARDEFLSLAAHELKTPLTPVRLLLQSLVRAAERPSEKGGLSRASLRSRLTAILHSVERLESLVESLLDISRMTIAPMELQRTEVDLAAAVREVIERKGDELKRSGSNIRLSLEDGVAGVWDAERIEQVITNLLSNALKYGVGKPVEVTVERIGDRARLSIRDYGIGVSLAEQAHIFERFGRAAPLRNYGGFGLGLWTARQIVDAHGGSIRIESAPGEGAMFIVDLPSEEPGRAARAPQAAPPPGG